MSNQHTMKAFIKYLTFLMLPVVLIGLMSCEKEDDSQVSDGPPSVSYIRSTNPALSDSLLVGSFMGSLIAIVGDNLGDTRELWFNDQRATLNPTYVTKKSIIVSVPSTVPTVVTNKIRFVFGDGSELLHDFSVNVPAPTLTGIKCEYVPDGETVTLYGDFFFDPKVIFPGEVEATVVSFTKTEIQATVPTGATPGQIVVKTTFGSAKSKFYFRDDRNIILDYDTKLHETWTAPITNTGNNPAMEECAGSYVFFKSASHGAWQWVNEMTMQYWAPRGRGNVAVASGLPSDLSLKFEANVPIEWKSVRMEIFFAPYSEDHGRDLPSTVFARWRPWKDGPYKTDGWETITIPLSEFKYGKDDPEDGLGSTSISNLASLTNITMMLFGPADEATPIQIAVDNIRIVQN